MKKIVNEYFMEQLIMIIRSTKSSIFASILSMMISILVAVISIKEDGEFPLLYYVICFVIGLFTIFSFYRFVSLKNEKKKIRDKYPGLIVVGIMSLKREKNSYHTIAILVCALMIYMALAEISGYSSNNIVIFIFLLVGTLLLLRERLIMYRVRQGYFGQNESEAREIIRFIISNSNNKRFYRWREERKLIFSIEDFEDVSLTSWRPSTVGTMDYLDKATKLLSDSIGILTTKRLLRISIGALFGVILIVLNHTIGNILDHPSENLFYGLDEWIFIFVGIFIAHIPTLISLMENKPEFDESIEFEFRIIDKAKNGGMPDYQVSQAYRYLCESIVTLRVVMSSEKGHMINRKR